MIVFKIHEKSIAIQVNELNSCTIETRLYFYQFKSLSMIVYDYYLLFD